MARRITPVAIRLESGSTHYEVLTASGSWVSWALLPEYNRQAVREAMVRAGAKFPTAGQTIYFDKNNESPIDVFDDEPTPPPSPFVPAPDNERKTDPRPTPDWVDTDDTDDMPGPKDGPTVTTIEDIVRRIAGELDDDVRAEVSAELLGAMDARIQDFLANNPPVGPSPVRDVVREIILREPDQPDVVHEGIFHPNFDTLVRLVKAGLHVFLPGEPGTGKSHAGEQVATILDWAFASLSLGPTTPESRLWGGMDANGKFFEPPFVRLARYAMDNPDKGAVFCLDEMDNGHAGILATLNSAMANGWFTAPNGDVITFGKNYVILGAANTFGTGPTAEFSGRNKLDAATLNRFRYLPWGTDEGMETAICQTVLADEQLLAAWLDVWRTARKNVADHGLKIFVTMRGAIMGARMLANGFTVDEALMLELGNKVPADQWKKINPL